MELALKIATDKRLPPEPLRKILARLCESGVTFDQIPQRLEVLADELIALQSRLASRDFPELMFIRAQVKDRIEDGGLSVGHILDIVSDIAQGLDFAHEKGFVHRDVKPGNVLFRNDGRVVLADFGIAKAMDGSNSSTVAGASIGTPDYMSPEQARGEPVDGRSDLYSLGTVLFEMLEGHPPYQSGDPFTVALMHVTHPVPTLSEKYQRLQPLVLLG